MNKLTRQNQLRKGILELCILKIIELRQPIYSSDILKLLKQENLIVVEGTLYPILTRIKNQSLVMYKRSESNLGPPRKYYYLTEDGQTHLKSLTSIWNQLSNVVNTFLNTTTI